MPSRGEVRVDSPLQACLSQLVDSRDLRLRERLVREIGERASTPQPQRFAELLLRDEALEATEVELVGPDHELIAGRARDDSVTPDCLSQLRDVHLQRLDRRFRGPLTPERLDQRVRRDDAVGVEEEDGQQRALLGGSQLDRAPVLANFERTE